MILVDQVIRESKRVVGEVVRRRTVERTAVENCRKIEAHLAKSRARSEFFRGLTGEESS
jgi:hypothetical protein